MTWCLSDNFGDRLGPWLFKKIAGRRPVYVYPQSDVDHYLTVGSILNWANSRSIVWGAGLASLKDDVPMARRITAVRGPMSRIKALQAGNDCPAVFGDPGTLISKYFKPMADKVPGRIGIFPHYVDLVRAYMWFKDPRFLIIDPLDPVEQVLNDIFSCEKVVSSALHGIIAADSLGVPNAWVKMSSSIGGDGIKYWDYFNSVGRANLLVPSCPAADWSVPDAKPDINSLRYTNASKESIQQVQEILLDVCPFKSVER